MEQFQMELAGRTLTIETGELAKQASGAALVRYGDTVVLVTATGSKEAKDIDFFPLTVDYEEKMYAVGRIPGGFVKREGRPPETAILHSRLIDRPIRPLFDKGCRNEVHVVATVLSVDQDNAPEICGMIGASAALAISDIPWAGPIAGVRMGRVNGEFVVNPTVAQLEESDLNVVVAGTKDAILMVEGGAQEVPEEVLLEVIMTAHEEIKRIVAFQEDMVAKVGKEKRVFPVHEIDEEVSKAVHEYAHDALDKAVRCADKQQRDAQQEAVFAEVLAHFEEIYPEQMQDVSMTLEKMVKEIVRHMITVEKIRPDGRKLDEVRPISVRVGVLPRTHGSGLFTRGQTQVLNICTLAPLSEKQTIDGIGIETEKRYIHHYNFPSYSVGETKSSRGPGRREIGHGALAERALVPVIPSEEEFPYALRLVSEVLESNGSSSMASVCGSTLSLMDAGVPIKAPVAGVAMGLVTQGEHYTILTDIQGMEDALGDMDFKVAGTTKGVTAIQMDIKISGLSREILSEALQQAHKGRMHIMGKMMEVIDAPRGEMSQWAPRIITIHIDPDKIRDVIGQGGKVIRGIIEETGTKIDIEDDGTVYIASVEAAGANRAIEIITSLTKEPEVGEVYMGKVTRLMNFGAFVEILPGKEGLVHISKLAKERVEKVEDVVNVGDEIMVKVIEIDKQGRINLSRKDCLK
ncbi:polyribonucleotide nucleotidyltransferase [Veillonella magna]|uniref:Polyribonucleotide nucleotidyltransferase n=1 Tax=Veillonella magna TaxID=464322 RepID=A0ABS2GDK9_9FIRM|nr:polyribonucleotide nucleotidyltransferase [Veillonella magna]MBD8976874.1 polyribonucleotide nucleotidyltransferase [Veillonella magna]MBM6823951.1 polyribonucleotide nucleotidyltransferase [Veillonella magna]MBM6912091.1 polyribonucleotide nucleotidyltransferase [Veillonella magna]